MYQKTDGVIVFRVPNFLNNIQFQRYDFIPMTAKSANDAFGAVKTAKSKESVLSKLCQCFEVPKF